MSDFSQPDDLKHEKGIAAFAVRHMHFTIVAFSALTIVGLVSWSLLPKDLLPASKAPGVQILSFYPGMPVEDMEQEITFPYERYSGQAVGIRSQESRSLTGVSIVRNFFQSDVDIGAAISQTGALVMSVLRKLPPGTQPPLILPFDPMASQPLAIATISGENKTETQLQDIGRYSVINAIQTVPGAMAPTVMGGKLRQAIVYLDPKKLSEKNLSPLRVNEKLQAMNTFVPSGDISIGDFDFSIHSNGMFKELSEIDGFYLRSRNGVSVRVGDVGNAEDAAAIQTNIVTVDGKRQVYVPVYRQLGANSLKVIDDVKASLKNLQVSLNDVTISLVSDQTIFIRRAIDAISLEALIGGALAALMIFVFLGNARATVAVLLTLPISVIGTFAVLHWLGHTLNVMTLGGLALSIGVLVDNAIVVIEVIIQKQKDGMNQRKAALVGAKEVAMPVLASTLATLAVFVPILYLSGIIQTLFTALAISVVAAMGISYFSAMMVIPLYATYFLKVTKETGAGIFAGFRRWFDGVTQTYGRTLHWTLLRSKPVLVGAFALHALLTLALIFTIGTELFPRADSGSFKINIRGKTGYRIQKTAEIENKIEKKLREIIPPSDLKMVISNIGIYYGYSAAFTRNSGSQDAFIDVELSEQRAQSSQHYAKIIREEFKKTFPDVEVSIELGGLLTSALNGGLPSPLDIQIGGPNIETSRGVAESLLPKIKSVNGAVDVRIQQRFDAPTLNVTMDRKKVSTLGLTPDIVVKNVVSAISNSTSYNPSIWIDPKTGIDYLLGVQFREENINSKHELLQVPITSNDQDRAVALRELADVHESVGMTEVNHKNLQPVIDIYLDSQDRDIGSVGRDIQKILEQEKMPVGTWSKIQGEYSEMHSSIQSLGWGFLFAACLVYFILVVQFESFLFPAIIMTNIPLGIVGVIVMLATTRTYFSIQAAIGCIFVIGVSVSHSVLLLEYILEKVKEHGESDEAIVKASMARLRPILMTSLASILGLLPMALGHGQGAEANIPLGRAVIGGQILSTFLNFYLLPCLYRQLAKRRNKKRALHLQPSEASREIAA